MFPHSLLLTLEPGRDARRQGFLTWDRGCGIEAVLQDGLRHLGRVVALPEKQVGDGGFIYIAAINAGHIQQTTGLVFGKESGIPALQRPRLVELLVVGDNLVELPHKAVITEHRQELHIKRLLPIADAGRQHVLGIDVLSSVRRGPVAVFSDAHDLPGNTEMLQHGVPHGKPALKEAHVLAVGIPQLFHPHISAQGRHPMAFIYAAVLFFPIGCENVELLFRGSWYDEHKRRGGVIVEEPLLELRRVFVDFHLIGNALRHAQAPHERVQRVKLFHHEHIIHRHGHGQPAR